MTIENRLSVICVNGLDSIYLLLSILEDGSIDSGNMVVLMALDGNLDTEWQTFYEKQLFPILFRNQIRTVQIGRVSNKNKDGLIVFDDTCSPQRYFGSECFSLEKSLLTFGMAFPGPSYLYKFKGWLLRRWILDTFAGEDIQVFLGLHKWELDRLEKKHDLYGLKTNEFWFLLLPLAEEGIKPKTVLKKLAGRFGSLPQQVPIIPDGRQGVDYLRAYYSKHPQKARTALLVEYIGLALNPRQMSWRGIVKDSLRESLNNWEVEAFFQDYMNSLPWCIYQVKRVRGGGGARSITKSQVGTQDFCLKYLIKLSSEDDDHPRAELSMGRRIWRLWFFRSKVVEHFLVAMPNLLEASEPVEFQLNWQKYFHE